MNHRDGSHDPRIKGRFFDPLQGQRGTCHINIDATGTGECCHAAATPLLMPPSANQISNRPSSCSRK